jgi:23S rRNA pseudouridine955/2504/2580 synthase
MEHLSPQFLNIDADRSGQRIDNFLFNQLKTIPKSRIYRALRSGEIRVNKKRIKADYRLQADDIIRLPPFKMDTKAPTIVRNQEFALLLARIIYEDEDLLVLNKPAGMPVHGGTNTSYGVIDALRQARPECKSLELVHRLDKGTSGCLIIAKRRSALKYLHDLMRESQIEKEYLCLVKGVWLEGGKRHVKVALKKNILQSGERMVRVDATGKEAHTEFTVVEKFKNCSLIKARLHTGRTHQIRVHLEHIGYPLVGDDKYGDWEFTKQLRNETGLKRMFLHAQQISFILPSSEKTITIEAPLDKDLTQCLQTLI